MHASISHVTYPVTMYINSASDDETYFKLGKLNDEDVHKHTAL